jgi:hypothetical protein
MSSESLYRRVLGSRFDELHPNLRRFHGSSNGGAAIGRFRVRRHSSRLGGTLAALAGLPANSDDTEVRVVVSCVGAGELWVRSFAGVPLPTRQTLRSGLLIEQAGPTHFGFTLNVVNGGMVFVTRRVWMFGVSLPSAVAPVLGATVTPTERGWTVCVRMCLPLLGPFLEYEGEVIPQWK